MMCFRRGFPPIGLVVAAVAAAVVVVAALTTWWVLFALLPVAMMVGCMAMMAGMARWPAAGSSAARWGCCGPSAPFMPTDRRGDSESRGTASPRREVEHAA